MRVHFRSRDEQLIDSRGAIRSLINEGSVFSRAKLFLEGKLVGAEQSFWRRVVCDEIVGYIVCARFR